MSKKNTSKKEEQEFYENPEVLAEKLSKTEELVEKNKGALIGIVAVIILLVGGFFYYNRLQNSSNEEATQEAFQAIYYYEADSLDKALNGDGNNLGLLEIIDEYGSTKTGNLANFYAGSIYLKKGDYQSAIDYLSDFDGGDLLVQARAYSLIGDAYMELGNAGDAASYYVQAAEYKGNEQYSPTYWNKAAIAYEKLGDYKKASDCFDVILTKYPKSNQKTEARKQVTRLKALAGG